MTIASAIQNAQEKVRNAYTAVSEKKGVLPTTQNLESLPGAIRSISGGDTVKTTAMSGAENFTGGEKVILNPAESTTAGLMTVTGGEIASGTDSQTYLTGGAIVGDKIYGSFTTTVGVRPVHTLYSGNIEGDSISLTQSAEPSPYNATWVTLPVFSKNNVGICWWMWDYYHPTIRHIDSEGVVTTLASWGGYGYEAEGFSMNEDGTVFVIGNYRSSTIYFVEKDLSLTTIVATKMTAYPSLFQIGEEFYYQGRDSIVKFTKTSGPSKISTQGTYCSLQKPLDKQGTLLGIDIYGSKQCYIQKFNYQTNVFTTLTPSQQGDALPVVKSEGSIAVLPITSERNVADIYIIPDEIPARIDHYVWNGSRLTNKGSILSSTDLGEYVYAGNDLHLDGNKGILWGTFYKTSATSGAQGKIFALRVQGRTVMTQFKAEPADKAVFDPSKSLTGFVDSNLGKDVMGNTEISVKTALDPNAEPWSDIGRVFGFDVKVTKGE